MWTYHEETTVSKSELYSHPPKNEKITAIKPAMNAAKRNTLRKRHTTHFQIQETVFLSGAYLIGLLVGSVVTTFANSSFTDYAQSFANFSLSFYQTAEANAILGMRFLTAFLILTVVFMMGFCVFGKWLLPLLLFLKGCGTGCFWIECIETLGFSKGFLAQLLIFLIPEVIGTILVVVLSKYALQISSMLWDCCQDRICPAIKTKARQLINAYLINCLAEIIPSLLIVILIRLFGSICGFLG